jgi:hypothetical protein
MEDEALRREIDHLRERLSGLSRPSMALIAASLVGLVAGLGLLGWRLSHAPAPADGEPGAAFCRACTDLARLERAMDAGLAVAGERGGGIEASERERVLAGIKGWHRRCSTLLCETRAGAELACAAPSTALLTELAAIDSLSDGLAARTALCSQAGCQSTRCGLAHTAARAFGTLQVELKTLLDNPPSLAGERRDLLTAFVFDEIGTLNDTVLSAPVLAAQGRYAAAEARLLFLRDAALAAGANVPESAESLLADRLEEVTHTIDALAKAERVGMAGAALGGLWQDFSDAAARLLLEAASFKAQTPPRASAFAALVAPQVAPVHAKPAAGVCDGAVRLVQSTEQRLSGAMQQLEQCNIRADCRADDDTTAAVAPRWRAGKRSVIEELSAQSGAASEALRAVAFQKDEDVQLETDLPHYSAREAITVNPLAETNRCLSDRGSRLVLASDSPEGAAVAIESHPLDPSDAAAWLFEAPGVAGRYRFVLQAPEMRGAGVFGQSAVFEVAAAPAGCDGFSGTWQTDFGILSVRVRDGAVRGSYRQSEEDRAGILEGRVEAGVVVGRWFSELGAGGTRLALSADGRSFTGTWSQVLERVSGAGKWEGRCISAAAPEAAPAGATGPTTGAPPRGPTP